MSDKDPWVNLDPSGKAQRLRETANLADNGNVRSALIFAGEELESALTKLHYVEDQLAALQATHNERTAERDLLLTRLGACRDALESLLPGLTLDLRYAEPDDDTDAMRSRIETVTAALRAVEGQEP